MNKYISANNVDLYLILLGCIGWRFVHCIKLPLHKEGASYNIFSKKSKKYYSTLNNLNIYGLFPVLSLGPFGPG